MGWLGDYAENFVGRWTDEDKRQPEARRGGEAVGMSIVERVACALAPDVFKLPRVSLYKRDYLAAYERALAAIEAMRVTDEDVARHPTMGSDDQLAINAYIDGVLGKAKERI